MLSRCAVPAIVFINFLLHAPTAQAAAYQVEARTEAQAYEFRSYRGTSPDNPVLLPRRRIVQYLGVNAYELMPNTDLGFESNLRLFHDFGLPENEANLLDGVRTRDADLLYANLRYRGNALSGRVEGQLGRMVYSDVGDILAFDGLRIRYVSKFKVGAEVYGGFWVRESGFLGSSVYQPDGVRDSDVRRVRMFPDPATRPPGLAISESLDLPSPLLGAKLLVDNIQGVSGAIGYRKSFVGGNTDYERLIVEARYGRLPRNLNAFAGLEYDLFQGSLSQARLHLRYDQPVWAVSTELMRLQPTFSAQSIWYYFAYAPRTEMRVRGDLTPIGPFRYYVQGVHAIFGAPINEGIALSTIEDKGPSTNSGGSVGASARFEHVRSNVDVTYRNGYGGRQLWLDLSGGYVGDDNAWSVDGRISTANVTDAYNSHLRGTFLGVQVWGSYALTRAARFSLAVEQNVNPYTRSDTKVFLLFDVKAVL